MPDQNLIHPILSVKFLSKVFQSGGQPLTVLKDINFNVTRGSSVAIVGPSGSGKTTLLGLCAGLDEPTSGSVTLNDRDLGKLNENERAELRNLNVGFVFQNFQLIPTLTALENIIVPLELRGELDSFTQAQRLIENVGLGERANHYPIQLSGGEQQRVALARAFINDPKILFVDEPTGNLDRDNGQHVTDLLFSLNKASGTTLILVTHDQEIAARTERILRIDDGQLVDNEC
jgi:putative ABC transport system ATP-binding protein